MAHLTGKLETDGDARQRVIVSTVEREGQAFRSPQKTHPNGFRLGVMAFFVALDFALTFVPSALAFTTGSVPRALRIGWSMLRRTWPRCALYVLCPPLALNLQSLAYPTILPMLHLGVTAALAVVGLLAKGSTAAFYLRERRVLDPDGAAYRRDVDAPSDG